MRILPLCTLLFLLHSPNIAGAATQEHLVALPVLDSGQLTCKWWNDKKGNAARANIEAIANAFMEGYKAGRSGTITLYFVDGSKMGWFTGANTAKINNALDDYCREFPNESWTKALMQIYQK